MDGARIYWETKDAELESVYPYISGTSTSKHKCQSLSPLKPTRESSSHTHPVYWTPQPAAPTSTTASLSLDTALMKPAALITGSLRTPGTPTGVMKATSRSLALKERVSAASRWPPSTPPQQLLPPTEHLGFIASSQQFKSIVSHR